MPGRVTSRSTTDGRQNRAASPASSADATSSSSNSSAASVVRRRSRSEGSSSTTRMRRRGVWLNCGLFMSVVERRPQGAFHSKCRDRWVTCPYRRSPIPRFREERGRLAEQQIRDEECDGGEHPGEREIANEVRSRRRGLNGDVDQEVAGNPTGPAVASLPGDPQLGTVLDPRRDPNPHPPLGLDEARALALVARLDAAGRTRLDPHEPCDVEMRLKQPPGAVALRTVRIRLADHPAAAAHVASSRSLVENHPPRSALGIGEPELDPEVEVVAARRTLARVPKIFVEALVPAAPIAVPVIEES